LFLSNLFRKIVDQKKTKINQKPKRSLVDVVHIAGKQSNKLYLVFEYLDQDLKRYMDSVDGMVSPELVKVCSRSANKTKTIFARVVVGDR
jgi:hypothetical protein